MFHSLPHFLTPTQTSPPERTAPQMTAGRARPEPPPFSLINSHPFGSARSSPGREAAKRTLDGEDRSDTMKREGKGDCT